MDLDKTLKQINESRYITEACFVFACWSDTDLFDDYLDPNNPVDLRNPDAKYYWNLGKSMYEQGIRNIDAVSIEEFLSNKPKARKQYEKFGGYQTVEELCNIVNSDNAEAYFDKINKMNALSTLAEKYEDIFTHVDRFNNASSSDVYDAFELLNNSIAISTNRDTKIEKLTVTQQFYDDCKNGENIGIQYAEYSPILNYTTLGLPLGDVTLLSSFSGMGKSSFVFANIVMPISKYEPVTIFSNEMQIKAYQNLMTIHILTRDLDYWKQTRKKIKMGKIEETEEEKDLFEKVKEISETKYNITFVKIFNNDSSIILKCMKRLSHQGCRCFIWDTFKGDDVSDGNDAWYQLLKNSRKIFNLTSKLNVSLFCTFQLALYTTNQRYLDASCLSSSKQIKEVVSELIMMRKLWTDEYSGQKNDCKAYKLDKDNGYQKVMLELDPDKDYYVFFINKTRNDGGGKEILYRWDAQWNKWTELGYCTIRNDHRGG